MERQTEIKSDDLFSLGYLCQHIQRGPREIAKAARRLGLSFLSIDGTPHFTGDQAESIAQFLAEGGTDTPDPADAPMMEPSADVRREANRCPLDLLDAIETADAEHRPDLAFALAVSCGQRADTEAQEKRGELLPLLARIADGDADAIAEARAWIVDNIITKADA